MNVILIQSSALPPAILNQHYHNNSTLLPNPTLTISTQLTLKSKLLLPCFLHQNSTPGSRWRVVQPSQLRQDGEAVCQSKPSELLNRRHPTSTQHEVTVAYARTSSKVNKPTFYRSLKSNENLMTISPPSSETFPLNQEKKRTNMRGAELPAGAKL